MVHIFFLSNEIFFCHKKNERFKNHVNQPNAFIFEKKGVAFLPLIGQNIGAQQTRILAFSRPWNETGLAEMEGFSVQFFFFFLPTISPLLSNLPLFHFYLSCVSIFPSRVCTPYYLRTMNFYPPLVVCDVWLGSETRFFTPF